MEVSLIKEGRDNLDMEEMKIHLEEQEDGYYFRCLHYSMNGENVGEDGVEVKTRHCALYRGELPVQY